MPAVFGATLETAALQTGGRDANEQQQRVQLLVFVSILGKGSRLRAPLAGARPEGAAACGCSGPFGLVPAPGRGSFANPPGDGSGPNVLPGPSPASSSRGLCKRRSRSSLPLPSPRFHSLLLVPGNNKGCRAGLLLIICHPVFVSFNNFS